jgi:methionine--tRNA ligase beta chain
MVFTYLEFFGDPTSSTTSSGLRGARKSKVDELKELYVAGKVSDIEVKNYLFECLMKTFEKARARYQDLKTHPEKITKILEEGAAKAKAVAAATMKEVRETIGLINQYSIDSTQAIQNNIITIDEFGRIEMSVGKVLEATNKEGSEKLIRLIVDVGEDKPRIIFTAVRTFGYTPDYFAGKQFFFITNLAPRKMMDEYSQGMIMAVDGAQGKPQFISADGMPVGAKIR